MLRACVLCVGNIGQSFSFVWQFNVGHSFISDDAEEFSRLQTTQTASYILYFFIKTSYFCFEYADKFEYEIFATEMDAVK